MWQTAWPRSMRMWRLCSALCLWTSITEVTAESCADGTEPHHSSINNNLEKYERQGNPVKPVFLVSTVAPLCYNLAIGDIYILDTSSRYNER